MGGVTVTPHLFVFVLCFVWLLAYKSQHKMFHVVFYVAL